jgi:hypothetical protein
MTDELNFKTVSLFKSVTYEKDADSWHFEFSDNIGFFAQTLWRLLDNKRIELVSLDNGHQFGLPEPIDLVERLNEKLIGKHLLEIKVKQNTADLQLTLTDNLQIEIFITSSGYESYQFSIDKKNYIGLGSGEISFYENTT